MKILSMTATFGKLVRQTLTLKPDLNVIHAPNEWGKSTWCSFITAMLYGIDTRDRSTATTLADKKRYAPWSGEPMSGRMDILWQNRAITIERNSKGRVPFGEFRAYETESGLPVPELTAANCGEVLLGVEKSVFVKSGFVRLSDLPVTQDEALRRRLNALVTTGDESDAGDVLAQKLNALRNKCRHNKTGLLPQAEAQRSDLEAKLSQHETLQTQLDRIHTEQQELEVRRQALDNHQKALDYTAAREGVARLEQAKTAQQEAQTKLEQLTARCQMLPTEEFAAQQLQQLHSLRTQQAALDAEVIPATPNKPAAPEVFQGILPADALRRASDDKAAYDRLNKPVSPLLLILAALLAAAGIGLVFVLWYSLIPCVLAGGVLLALHFRKKNALTRQKESLLARYGTLPPEQWIPLAQSYSEQMRCFSEKEAAAKAIADSIQQRRQALHNSIYAATQGLTLEEAFKKWEGVIAEHQALANAQTALTQAQNRTADLSAAIQVVEPPAAADELTLNQAQTTIAIQNTASELQRLIGLEGQYKGQKETLGTPAALRQQLDAVNARITALEDAYSALTIAMETLTDATNELQRRFAPRISSRAQTLFGKMTGGRYDRLQLSQDLSLNAAAADEVSLQPALWRSDGTIDQLYLSLRLAVAEELTPEAPLVLDDALVRFDDTRLASALDILKEASQQKQVILFTCQSREEAYLSE